MITSQLPTKNWHESLADPTLADAICDRLVHNAHVLSLRGPSLRKKKGMNQETNKNEKTDHPSVASLRLARFALRIQSRRFAPIGAQVSGGEIREDG